MILSILKFSGGLYLRNLHKFLLLSLLLALAWTAAALWILDPLIPLTIQEFQENYERTALIFHMFLIIKTTSIVFLTILLTDKFASNQGESNFYSPKQRFGQLLQTAMLFSIVPLITYLITIALHHNLAQGLSNIPKTSALADYLLSTLNGQWALLMALLISLLALLIFCRLSLTPYFIILENLSLIQAIKSSVRTTQPHIWRLTLLYFLLLIAALLITFLVITPALGFTAYMIMENYINSDQLLGNMNNGLLQPVEIPAIVGFLASSLAEFLLSLLVIVPVIVVSYIAFLYLNEPIPDNDD